MLHSISYVITLLIINKQWFHQEITMLQLKTVKIILLSTFITGLTAIHGAYAAEKFKVITTFTVIADMAQNVAGDAAEVSSITRPGAEIHEYQPTTGDIKRAQGAQLILSNGFNLELWFQKFYQRLKNRTGCGGHYRYHSNKHYRGSVWWKTKSSCLDVAW